jgi:GNAT superfamily N-acetyltransferase
MGEVSKGISLHHRNTIEEILKSSDFFYDFEVQIALEIVDETLSKGIDKSGYLWMKITEGNELVAFANYGKNPFSTHSWDIYWMAVQQNLRNKKLGSLLLKTVEEDIRQSGGKIIRIETSGRSLYSPTENFYKRNGYTLKASLEDFYAPGDPKQIYSKTL